MHERVDNGHPIEFPGDERQTTLE